MELGTTLGLIVLNIEQLISRLCFPSHYLERGAEIDMDGLWLSIRIQCILAKLATNTRGLVATEGNSEMGIVR